MPDGSAATTSRHALPYIIAGQSMKHIPHNEALEAIDTLLHTAIQSRSEASPPADPSDGSLWIVAGGAGGAWAGHDGDIAQWRDNAWRFVSPLAGTTCFLLDETTFLLFTEAGWTDIASLLGLLRGADLGANQPLLGLNATADSANRLSVHSSSVLFSHDTSALAPNDCRIKINKGSYAGAAEISYERGYSARAITGLNGSDDFALKVSDDGMTWTEALRVDGGSGAVTLRDALIQGDITLEGDSWLSNTITVASDSATGRYRCRRARGSLAAPQSVQNGDTLFSFSPMGHDGSDYKLAGGLSYLADDDFASAVSSSLRIATSNQGIWTEAMRIMPDGSVGIGTASPQTLLDVRGPIRTGTYTVATLPAASGKEGALIFVSDASGGATMAFCDGTDWRRFDSGAIIS